MSNAHPCTPNFHPQAGRGISYTPLQVADAYHFPQSDGAGQTIGIVELGGGYTDQNLDIYFKGLQVVRTGSITAVPVGGARNEPDGPNGADGEVQLDIEIAAALAPAADVRVYFCPNTDRGFLAGIERAIGDGCTVGSISWGGPESSWDASTMKQFDAVFARSPFPWFVAAGDNGSSDGTRATVADFPASSPHVIACGGTNLQFDGKVITSETVWDESASSATGGGFSRLFTASAWQTSLPEVGPAGFRGLPDVTGCADPATGYQVLIDGQYAVIGGTSAVAPLYAALWARLQALGVHLTVQDLYDHPEVFRDVTEGSNGAYQASAGWDATSGLGSIVGQSALALGAGVPVTPPTPTPVSDQPPITPPTPTPTGYQAALDAALEYAGTWAYLRHTGGNKTMAADLRAVLEARAQ